jgi:hypothetical protein
MVWMILLESDYLPGSSIGKDETMENLADAERFITEIERWLKQENWI